jgi:hypothetical protein
MDEKFALPLRNAIEVNKYLSRNLLKKVRSISKLIIDQGFYFLNR